jgi:hypothetical protein
VLCQSAAGRQAGRPADLRQDFFKLGMAIQTNETGMEIRIEWLLRDTG